MQALSGPTIAHDLRGLKRLPMLFYGDMKDDSSDWDTLLSLLISEV